LQRPQLRKKQEVMPRDYRKAQRERDKKKRSQISTGTKSSKTVPSNKPSGTASGTKSSREMTHLEKINNRAAYNYTRSPIKHGQKINNQGVVKRTEHYQGDVGMVAHGAKHIKPLKPKPASPIKGRDIPLPKTKF
jgi:hypothetical protein